MHAGISKIEFQRNQRPLLDQGFLMVCVSKDTMHRVCDARHGLVDGDEAALDLQCKLMVLERTTSVVRFSSTTATTIYIATTLPLFFQNK